MIDASSLDNYRKALEIILEQHTGRISTSMIQRRLRLGYTQAARIMDLLEEKGVVTMPQGLNGRIILLSDEQIKQHIKGGDSMRKSDKQEAAEKKDKVTFLETPFDANLKVPLTQDEVMVEAEKMARLQVEIAAKEDEAASVSKRYKSEIEALICNQDSSAGLIRDKFRFKTIKCIRRMDWETGYVTESRSDTGAVLEKREMTVAESQLQLDLQAQEDAKKAE